MKIKRLLPSPFFLADGDPVTDTEQWSQWREDTKELISELAYGTIPPAPEDVEIKIIESSEEEGQISFQMIKFTFRPKKSRPDIQFDMEVSIRYPTPSIIKKNKDLNPKLGEGGLPCVVYVGGNSCQELYESGYVVVNYQNDQIEPMEMGNPIVGPAQRAYQELEPDKYTWGSIAVWAWGAMRVVDYVLTRSEVNNEQIIITGHSRNGKTALLAGALDERIAIVNPAGSGCAGAGSYIALDEGCEDIAALTDTRRWWAWMCPEFAYYGYKEEQMIFDQHFVMGLVAPRPLLRTEGILDEWANPKGTSVAFVATEEIYKFLGVSQWNQLALRPGGHTHNRHDMLALLSMANAYFFGLPQERIFKDLVCDIKELPPFMDWKSPK